MIDVVIALQIAQQRGGDFLCCKATIQPEIPSQGEGYILPSRVCGFPQSGLVKSIIQFFDGAGVCDDRACCRAKAVRQISNGFKPTGVLFNFCPINISVLAVISVHTGAVFVIKAVAFSRFGASSQLFISGLMRLLPFAAHSGHADSSTNPSRTASSQ